MKTLRQITGKLLPVFVCSLMASTAANAFDYSSSSLLSEGKWVKIGIAENGLYEISYEKLRELGFNNPEKVGVWGETAAIYPLSFTNSNNERLIYDDLRSVSVIHENDKLYFYGAGPENISWNSTRFVNDGRNIYSDYGIYFLSDRVSPTEINSNQSTSPTTVISKGNSYFYHEKDVNQGPIGSGQVFWGEDFIQTSDREQEFQYNLHGFVPSSSATLECSVMASTSSASYFYFGLSGSTLTTAKVPALSGQYAIRVNTVRTAEVYPDSQNGAVKVTFTPGSSLKAARLDFLLLSYSRAIAFDTDESSFITTIDCGNSSGILMPTDTGVKALDVTTPNTPIQLLPNENGYITPPSGSRNLVFYKSGETQKTPEWYETVANQDIHSLASTINPDMIILTTSDIEPYAQQLAELHEVNDGTTVLVLKASDVYNEFSSGRPEAMAYRNLCKMFYSRSDSKLRNLLLFGPVKSNVRDVAQESMILYQSPEYLRSSDTYSYLDAYGMLDDYYDASTMYNNNINIGVGVLPAMNAEESARIVEKTALYMLDDSPAYWLSDITYLADDADSMLHIGQTETLTEEIGTYSNYAIMPKKVYYGEYGQSTCSKFINNFDDGNLMVFYTGHGSTTSMGLSGLLLTTRDLSKFTNSHLGFMTFAGCFSTSYETGIRGIPEHLILSYPNGLVGGMLSVRDSWSTENLIFTRQLQKTFCSAYDANTGKPYTIGEINRLVKNADANSGKYKFHLMADPEIRIPYPALSMDVNNVDNIEYGKSVNIKGDITLPNGSKDNNFNGTIVAKLYRPAHTETSQNKISGYTTKVIDITYNEDMVTSQAFKVVNGSFDADLFCPSSMSESTDSTVRLMLTAYDSNRRLASAKPLNVKIIAPTSEITDDTESPVIESMYVDKSGSDIVLYVEATDNVGLRTDETSVDAPLMLILDGSKVQSGVAGSIKLEDGARRMIISYPISSLESGDHTLLLRVKDFAGNNAASEIKFNIGGGDLLPAPTTLEIIGRDKVTISIPDETASATGTGEIIIIDSFGNTVKTAQLSSNEYVWNLQNNSGERVPAGVYRAYVKYTATAGNGTVSNYVRIPVLKAL
jgi:hypothetical protein